MMKRSKDDITKDLFYMEHNKEIKSGTVEAENGKYIKVYWFAKYPSPKGLIDELIEKPIESEGWYQDDVPFREGEKY